MSDTTVISPSDGAALQSSFLEILKNISYIAGVIGFGLPAAFTNLATEQKIASFAAVAVAIVMSVVGHFKANAKIKMMNAKLSLSSSH